MSNEALQAELAAIRETLQSLTAHFAPEAAPVDATDVAAASAFVWRPELHRLEPVPQVAVLCGVHQHQVCDRYYELGPAGVEGHAVHRSFHIVLPSGGQAGVVP